MPEQRQRLFVALPVPTELATVLLERGRAAVDSDLPVRWVPPGNQHLTLKFLGEVITGQRRRVEEALQDSTQSRSALDLRPGRPGVFFRGGIPQVLWWGLAGETEKLVQLARAVDRALSRCGFPRERRPFKPHLTLGRVKGPGPFAPEIFRELEAPRFSWRAKEILLMRSHLRPRGAVYEVLRVFPLAGGEEPGPQEATDEG
jgi:2'-5' RNA ligase